MTVISSDSSTCPVIGVSVPPQAGQAVWAAGNVKRRPPPRGRGGAPGARARWVFLRGRAEERLLPLRQLDRESLELALDGDDIRARCGQHLCEPRVEPLNLAVLQQGDLSQHPNIRLGGEVDHA